MKNINLFNLIAIASLCATILHGAVPPAESPEERMAREQVEALKEARGGSLDEPAREIIQEYLPANQVSIKIVNSDRKHYYRVVFNDSKNITVRQSKWLRESRLYEKPEEEETVLVPIIPLTINFYQKKYLTSVGHFAGSLSSPSQDVQNIKNIYIVRRDLPEAIISFRSGRKDRIPLRDVEK